MWLRSTLASCHYCSLLKQVTERAGTGNLNKPLSGESATFDCPTGRENGVEDGKKERDGRTQRRSKQKWR
jgi:hypothetical protein